MTNPFINEPIYPTKHIGLIRDNSGDNPEFVLTIGHPAISLTYLTRDEIASLREALADPDVWPVKITEEGMAALARNAQLKGGADDA